MNILFVHETEYIDKAVFEYQIIPEILASKGHHVYVIDYPTAWKKNGLLDFGSFKTQYFHQVKKANKKKGITLIRPGIIKIPILSRISAFIAYFFIISNAIKKYKINKIVLFAVPTNGLQTILLAKRYKIPILFRLLDVLHQLVPNKALSRPTYLMEKIVYRNISEIIAVTPRLANYAVRMGGSKNTTSYVPTGSDADLFYPQKKDGALLRRYGLKKKERIILFAGTLYNFSGLDRLIKILPHHLKKYPHLKFLIVGRGQQLKYLKELINTYRLQNNIIFTGFINYPDLAKYINLADICINPFEINKITNPIFPGKIYQYLACGKPVIATRLKGMIDLFPDHQGEDNIYYFNLNKPDEFYGLIGKIKKRKIKDTNPSLQEIAKIFEKKLLNLKSRV